MVEWRRFWNSILGRSVYSKQVIREPRIRKLSRFLLSKIFGKVRSESWIKRKVKENKDAKLERNVYCEDGTMNDYAKKQDRIHMWFKHLIVYPASSFITKFLGKYLSKDVSDASQFKELKIFSDTYDKTIVQWNDIFSQQSVAKETDIKKIKSALEKMHDTQYIKILKNMKYLLITLCQNDTAYLEFINMLLFNLTIEMNKNHNPKHNHLLYTSKSISDVYYFVLKDNNIIDQIKPTEGYELHIKP